MPSCLINFFTNWNKTITLCCCLLWISDAQGQLAQLTGRVLEVGSDKPIGDVLIWLQPAQKWTVSAADGTFQLEHLPQGAQVLTARILGYQPVEMPVPPRSGGSAPLVVYLSPLSFELAEVQVTAQEAQLGSSSAIGQAAIVHVQPFSLADVMQLAPGQLAENPQLGNPQQFLLRQAPAGAAANRMNALGTALLLDGAPVSNNANLQNDVTILNASPGALPPFSSTAGRGNDLRQIPADNIESVEVIRGIPSVRYGDLTSGAVIVNTRAGIYAPQIRVRTNPNIAQVAGGYGFRAGKIGTINTDLDLAFSQDDPRDFQNRFTRLTGQLAWSNVWLQKKLATTLRLSSFTTLDEARKDPDAQNPLRENYARERGFRFNAQGRYKTGWSALGTIEAVASLQSSHQEGYFQELIVRDIFPVSAAMTDTTLVAEYGKSEYLNRTTVGGRPLSAYSRLEAQGYLPTGAIGHRWMAGVEWRLDQNTGSGRQFDPRTPPRQNYSMGDRPRSFADIPPLHLLSAYLEDQLRATLAGRELTIQAGVRWDALRVEMGGQADWWATFSPRLNGAWAVAESWWLRGGIGLTAKMPTLSYLYPNPTFYDLINFNYYAANPAERLVVITTRQLQPDTGSLRPFRSAKWEAGGEFRQNGWELNATFFSERTQGGYQMTRWLRPLLVDKLAATAFPVGSPPVLSPDPVRVDTFLAAFDRPENNLQIWNRGIEWTLATPEWAALRTTVHLNGAWLWSQSTQTNPQLDANSAVFSSQTLDRVALYRAGQGQETQRLNTSLRVVHHVPRLGFIASLLVQTVWLESNRLIGYSADPVGYMRKDGTLVWLSPEQARAPAFDPLRQRINPVSLEWQKRPPLWLFNIRLTKEWRPGNGFAFYANNLFSSRPLFANNLTGGQQLRNQPTLFFGAEVYLRLN